MRRAGLILALALTFGISSAAMAQDPGTPQDPPMAQDPGTPQDPMMGGGTTLYTIDLESGELMEIGMVGDRQTVIAFAVDTSAALAGPGWGVTVDGQLLGFDVTTPETIDSMVEISGLPDGDWLVGIDVRPATGELIGISNGSMLFTIDTESGEAMALGDVLEPMLEADTLGFDFNPTVDRIRVDVSTTQNLRLNPETGAVGVNAETGQPTIDGNLAFADDDVSAGIMPRVVAAAYTNSVADAEETQLFVLDAETNSLALQDPPNDGVLNTIAPLEMELTDYTSFDIHPAGGSFVTIPMIDSMATPTA